MTAFKASQEVVDNAAQSCANNLAKLFGGTEEAIAALEADPVAMAQILMADFIKAQRHMTLQVHMNPRAFSRVVLDQIERAA
jgi:hypothetical protein